MNISMTDRELLDILDRHERQGQSASEIAKATGRTKSAVLGQIHRVRKAIQQYDEDGISNGSMPARWWE